MICAKFNMSHLSLFFLVVAALSTCSHGAPAAISKTIWVNSNGNADYRTIQEAVNSVPDNNDQWIKIHVAAGIYREKVTINSTKTNIFLEGEGADKTSIQWDDAGRHTVNSVLTTEANNFVASNIAFMNPHRGEQALAAYVLGDKTAFYGCRFTGIQDTLGDFAGRHYYKGCQIEGVVDFIYGTATTIFEDCNIIAVDGVIDLPGFITAHGRNDLNDPSGFVFKNCSIEGKQKMHLGRAWRPYSRVIFYKTRMQDIITPEGWVAWKANGREKDTTFVEYKCKGPGSEASHRVPWTKNLSDEELKPFIDMSFIDKEGWIDALPFDK